MCHNRIQAACFLTIAHEAVESALATTPRDERPSHSNPLSISCTNQPRVNAQQCGNNQQQWNATAAHLHALQGLQGRAALQPFTHVHDAARAQRIVRQPDSQSIPMRSKVWERCNPSCSQPHRRSRRETQGLRDCDSRDANALLMRLRARLQGRRYGIDVQTAHEGIPANLLSLQYLQGGNPAQRLEQPPPKVETECKPSDSGSTRYKNSNLKARIS
jgi:hypothetical protein